MTNDLRLLSIPISRVCVVRGLRDDVYFEIAQDPGGNLEKLHGEFDRFNGRMLTFDTVCGNGPNVARLLGWGGEIEIVSIPSAMKLGSGPLPDLRIPPKELDT